VCVCVCAAAVVYCVVFTSNHCAIMGIETAPGNKSKGSSTAAATGPNSGKNPPANPPVRQFANQLQQDIEDVTVEVNISCIQLAPHPQKRIKQ
jgi:hypothetical protein